MTVTVSSGLTAALKKVVLDLEDDLRERVESQPVVRSDWVQEHQTAVTRERTAMSWQEWRDDRVTQAAVAWVLTSVFVRFCEDNHLLKPVWIAGPVDRCQEALDAELAYFRENPEETDREWLLQAVEYLKATKATQDLVEEHSPLWTVSPSGQAVKRLLSFWRDTADGELVWDFSDPKLDTRFLGNLYQDLSEYAKKTFALLQTPEFVEEFILDQTLTPALKERPLEGFRLIDPTCGSGHFLLSAFAILNDRWASHAPGLEVQARVQAALDAIHGVDLNPFAVAIARFRLIVAALRACELASLEAAPGFTLHIVAGDSLLHGPLQTELDLGPQNTDAALSSHTSSAEDLKALQVILEPGRYDVVVGNPPYITVKDKNLNGAYRRLYKTCKGTYALTVPFMERFFQLAKVSDGERPAGWTGQITSNSFMKREFGSRLIEEFLRRKDLRLVVDTSGAFIPGHGTPTVILVGRQQPPVGETVKAVLGVRGEPSEPPNPAEGLVWTSIVENIDHAEFDNEYVTITSLFRKALAAHPWSLSGGAASGISAAIEGASRRFLSERVAVIGRTTHSGNDEAFFVPADSVRVLKLAADVVPVVRGEEVRDYIIIPLDATVLPNSEHGEPRELGFRAMRHLWRTRRSLEMQLDFGQTKSERGLRWFDHSMFFPERFSRPFGIAFPFVCTHNHFVLDRGGKVFNRTAPAIKLPEGATEDDHLALLGVLNSSVACFWLKQNSYPKGGDPIGDSGARASQQPWSDRYEFTGTILQNFPLPAELPTERARSLDEAAREALARFESATAPPSGAPTAGELAVLRSDDEATRARMIAEQEELDWDVYRSYGLLDDDLTYAGTDLPGLSLGERAFEIALARKVAAGEEDTAWFTRHGSTPIVEIPGHWPQAYQDLVQRRLDLIESNKFINLLERPEYKRRWSSESWEKRVEKALRSWLLDRLEDRKYWFDAQSRPAPRSIAQLSDAVSRDADLVSVLELWSGRKDQSVTQQLANLLENEGVPFLAAYRLKDSGLRKREAWEETWDLQRKEDKGEQVGTIPVPPKYTSADFRKQSWWQHRGKLDVPKERFILYPDASRETDPTQLLGWAGWDHAQQSLALATVIAERETEGWADERLIPLVAGLAELQPWVRQWHDESDATYQINLADYLDEELRGRALQVGLTVDQLATWRPKPDSRGRKAKS